MKLPSSQASLLASILATRKGAPRKRYVEACDGAAERGMLDEVCNACAGAKGEVELPTNRWRLALWLVNEGQPTEAPPCSDEPTVHEALMQSLWKAECALSGRTKPDDTFDAYGYPS